MEEEKEDIRMSKGNCYVLRAKRKQAEKPVDSLILEGVKSPNKKRFKVLSPEDYIQEKVGELVLDKDNKKTQTMIFQRVVELTEEIKGAKKVNIDTDSGYELFKLHTVKQQNIRKVEVKIDQKDKMKKQQELAAKKKRHYLLNTKRKEKLTELHNGN